MTSEQLTALADAYEASDEAAANVVRDIDDVRRWGADSGYWDATTEPTTAAEAISALANAWDDWNNDDADDAGRARAAWIAVAGSLRHLEARGLLIA